METLTQGIDLVSEPDRIGAILAPDRRRMLNELAEAPDSATGLARRLGDTRQRINYHLGALADAGFLELAEERQRRGLTERIYRPSSQLRMLDPEALGVASPSAEATGDAFSGGWLLALASRSVREVARLFGRGHASERRIPTTAVSAEVRLARPRDFAGFARDLADAVASVVERWDSPGEASRAFRVVAHSYQKPEIERDTEEQG